MGSLRLEVSICVLAFIVALAAGADTWAKVEQFMQSFTNLTDCAGCNCAGCQGFAFTAGDASGRKFTFEKGNMTTSKVIAMASASKFPAALAIAGAVADGHLSFDTHAHEVFTWWSRDKSDPRSGVTLRHLLSFTSGFYWDDASSGNASCLSSLAGSLLWTPEACAHQIYEQAPFDFAPGTTFAYNSFHLQIAAAMAAKAAHLTVQRLLHKYLIDKLGLKHTGWLLGQNPLLAAGMYTTANDYDALLHAYLAYKLVPKEVADQMEVDYLAPPFASKVCDWCEGLTDSFGHYSMCNWYECLADDNATKFPFTQQCKMNKIHMDLGLFGYYPLIDRAKGMYMQIAQSVIVGLNDTNPGCSGATDLRAQSKPLVDAALGHTGESPQIPQETIRRLANSKVANMGYADTSAALWRELAEALDDVHPPHQDNGSSKTAKLLV